MPSKPKPRNPVTPPDEVWIAPRPANQTEPKTFEPAGNVPSNRYLDFADIALGVKKTPFKTKKSPRSAGPAQHGQHPDGKVTPISRAKGLKPRPSSQGFGAFRGSH